MDIHPITLVGRLVRLEPLSEGHTTGLAKAGLHETIWRHMMYGNMQDEADIRAWVLDLLARQELGGDLPFAVVQLESDRAIGATRYLKIDPENRKLEIGGTWYTPDYQGVGVNADVKYLMLKHAFEALGCVRVQLKTDTRNLRSQRAIERLGAVKEGVLRKHIITAKGYNRDSVVYSILDDEWPSVKAGLENRLGVK